MSRTIYLENRISIETCKQILYAADTLNIDLLVIESINYLANNLARVVKSECNMADI